MTDLQRKEQFWDFMVQVRFEQEYYIVYRRKCLKITQWCKWTTKTITAIAVLLWMQWNTTQWLYSVCSIVILLMQIAELIIDKLPYESRLSDVTDLADDTLPVFRNIEAEWHRMEDDNYAFCEIPEKIREYSTQLDEIKRHYMKNDELPHEQDSITLATQKTQEYFQHF